EAVATIRAALADTFARGGGVHMQVGKSYKFAETHNASAYGVLSKIKDAVDPHGRVNPGSLGLGHPGKK
ncbi:MAG: FAD-binding oxidoreductase, partial [Pseudomonadota bacterium]